MHATQSTKHLHYACQSDSICSLAHQCWIVCSWTCVQSHSQTIWLCNNRHHHLLHEAEEMQMDLSKPSSSSFSFPPAASVSVTIPQEGMMLVMGCCAVGLQCHYHGWAPNNILKPRCRRKAYCCAEHMEVAVGTYTNVWIDCCWANWPVKVVKWFWEKVFRDSLINFDNMCKFNELPAIIELETKHRLLSVPHGL